MPKVGSFINIPSEASVEIAGISGLDFAIVDMEHGPIDILSKLPAMILAAKTIKGKAYDLWVRIPTLNSVSIGSCLDIGASHILVPGIADETQVRHAIESTFYNPIGSRGYCRYVRANSYGNTYPSNDNALLSIQIESVAGLANLKGILEAHADYLHCVFFGPYDLSQSLGIPGLIESEEVVSAITHGIKLCSSVVKKDASKVNTCVFAPNVEIAKYWQSKVDYLVVGHDVSALLFGFSAISASIGR